MNKQRTPAHPQPAASSAPLVHKFAAPGAAVVNNVIAGDEHLIEHHAHGIEIAAVIHRHRADPRFGCHEVGGDPS
jgi:hypothetical protein